MANNDEIQRRVLARLRAENQSLFDELLEREERTMRAERCRIVALPTTRRMRLGWYQRYLLSIQIPMAPIAVGWRCPTCRRPTYAAQACVRGADAILASHLTLVERVRRAEATLEELLPLAERLNRALAFVQRNPPRTLLPKIPRARALENARVLARELRANPTVPSRSRAGCWNCGMPHNMVMCPHPRGTFCQRCGEIGVYFEERRRCQPECPIDGPRRH
ncbi:uncharacterized protein LOC123263027 [Cotesia glomerata]|uniref:uncharacterized protein LOC123263027 n=1 Tax=Cotesia glomerata TaxID=32391 RepID=UPI001D0051BB|nr:uncharacterized protein LOC123263027 [Cotesia glomerata]